MPLHVKAWGCSARWSSYARRHHSGASRRDSASHRCRDRWSSDRCAAQVLVSYLTAEAVSVRRNAIRHPPGRRFARWRWPVIDVVTSQRAMRFRPPTSAAEFLASAPLRPPPRVSWCPGSRVTSVVAIRHSVDRPAWRAQSGRLANVSWRRHSTRPAMPSLECGARGGRASRRHPDPRSGTHAPLLLSWTIPWL